MSAGPDRARDAAEAAPPAGPPARGPSSPLHWLARIAERAGLGGARSPDVPPGTATREAWGVITRGLGLDADELAEAVAAYFRLEVASLEDADPGAARLVSESLVRKHHVFPLAEDGRQLWVATSDPTDVDAERALGFATGRTLVFQVASPAAIQEAMDARFSPERAVEGILATLDVEEEDADAVRLLEEMGPEAISEDAARATPVIKLTNLILRDGIEAGASDIHIEPGRGVGVVRYRVDGVLRKHMDLPMTALNRVVSRIKILARMDIADRLRPQDGKARVQVEGQAYDLRISTLPAGEAEKCVVRILDSNTAISLDSLSIPAPELARMRRLLSHRDGIVVMTGPTGSGKTTTLYGALRELADGKVNIMTVEDPIEYDLPAITQTQVQTKQGLTFGSALRSILRQDPDVILVGEIRDKETAEVAAQAALTGHLVLATVHANDAVSAVQRLGDLGLQYSTIGQALRGALAQRLLRKACPACAEPVGGSLTPEERRLSERHGVEPVVRAVGCPDCGFTGHRGRLPVAEVMVAGPRFQKAVEERKGWGTLTRVAQEGGMRALHEVALDWVREGKATLVEVERVLGESLEDEPEHKPKGPPRILLVDDDPEALLFSRTVLEAEGYDVTEAESGADALEMLRAEPNVSLCILDLAMPGLHGSEVLQRIRGSVDTAALPVMIRTGTGDHATEARLLESGADDYVEKSVEAARFVARVKAVLRRTLV